MTLYEKENVIEWLSERTK